MEHPALVNGEAFVDCITGEFSVPRKLSILRLASTLWLRFKSIALNGELRSEAFLWHTMRLATSGVVDCRPKRSSGLFSTERHYGTFEAGMRYAGQNLSRVNAERYLLPCGVATVIRLLLVMTEVGEISTRDT